MVFWFSLLLEGIWDGDRGNYGWVFSFHRVTTTLTRFSGWTLGNEKGDWANFLQYYLDLNLNYQHWGLQKGLMRMNQWWIIILLRWIHTYCIIISPYEWGMDIHKSNYLLWTEKNSKGELTYTYGENSLSPGHLFWSNKLSRATSWIRSQCEDFVSSFLGTPLSAYILYTYIHTYVHTYRPT